MKVTRQFWVGVLIGLSASSALRRSAAGGLDQPTIRRTYKLWAPVYRLANVYLLGQLPRLRTATVNRLQLMPGASVLEISCGTGANFPYIQERIGPSGRLVGIDYTLAMLEQARRLVARQGWQNVDLMHADAASLDLDEQFDGVLWVLAASVVPDWQIALERAVVHIKPGGWLAIADARLSDHWYARPFNWLADLMGLGAAADISRRPWELLPHYLTQVGYEDLLLGFLYITWGQMRRSPDTQ